MYKPSREHGVPLFATVHTVWVQRTALKKTLVVKAHDAYHDGDEHKHARNWG